MPINSVLVPESPSRRGVLSDSSPRSEIMTTTFDVSRNFRVVLQSVMPVRMGVFLGSGIFYVLEGRKLAIEA